MSTGSKTVKRRFDIGVALARIRSAVAPYPKAAMFELAERGYATPFQQLVACIISIRTRDEESLPLSLQLFSAAPTPEQIALLTPEQIDALIRPCTFHERKAAQIHEIARRTVEELGGEHPEVAGRADERIPGRAATQLPISARRQPAPKPR